MRIVFEPFTRGCPTPAVLIDRDGVINLRRPNDYVLNWQQFAFVPGICEALRGISALGLPMIVISNQAAVGKGLLEPKALEEITTQLHHVLLSHGVTMAAYYYCPHRLDEGCNCRKPKPGLLFQAATDLDIDLSRSVFIGDSQTDIQAAQAAHCRPLLFASGLRSDLGLPDWANGVCIARSASELLAQVSLCLGGAQGVSKGSEAVYS